MAAVRPKEGGRSANRGKVNRRNGSKSETTPPEDLDVRSGSGSRLPKPLGPNSRRILLQETSDLIRKRNELDRALLVQAFRPLDQLNATDWLPREELLRQCERLVNRERDYIRTRNKELDERTVFYTQDPSEERALDLDFIRNQLWKFKRHLGPYLDTAQEPQGDDEEGGPSVGLDGAFDVIRGSRKRKSNELDGGKKPRKKARKEQASGSSQSTTPQSQSAQTGPPTRSKEMESSLAQIYTSMSQTKSSQANMNGAIKVEIKEEPVKTAPRDVSEDSERKPPKTSASSSSNSISDGAVRPFYQRHAKAMIRPDFDDLVYDRPQHRRGPKSKQKRRAYLVSGALPVPHLPSPRPDKSKARSASTDGP